MGGIYLGPCLDYWQDLSGCEVGECEVMGGREGKDIAFACDGICAEEETREI